MKGTFPQPVFLLRANQLVSAPKVNSNEAQAGVTAMCAIRTGQGVHNRLWSLCIVCIGGTKGEFAYLGQEKVQLEPRDGEAAAWTCSRPETVFDQIAAR